MKISGLPQDTSPTTTDYIVIVDTETGQTKKVLLSDLSNMISPSGAVVQVVTALSSAGATGTTLIPFDDTIPQNTEGDQYLTATITPKSATNLLIIEVVAALSSSNNNNSLIGALFQDSTASAIAADATFNTAGTAIMSFVLKTSMAAGSVAATTFKFRAGLQAAGTMTFNGSGSARSFGAIPKSALIITEIKV